MSYPTQKRLQSSALFKQYFIVTYKQAFTETGGLLGPCFNQQLIMIQIVCTVATHGRGNVREHMRRIEEFKRQK